LAGQNSFFEMKALVHTMFGAGVTFVHLCALCKQIPILFKYTAYITQFNFPANAM